MKWCAAWKADTQIRAGVARTRSALGRSTREMFLGQQLKRIAGVAPGHTSLMESLMEGEMNGEALAAAERQIDSLAESLREAQEIARKALEQRDELAHALMRLLRDERVLDDGDPALELTRAFARTALSKVVLR